MEDTAPRHTSEFRSTVHLTRRGILAVRHWPPGLDPSQPFDSQPSGTSVKESEILPDQAKVEQNCNKQELEGQIENVGDKRWMGLTVYPPPKRRGILAIRTFPPGCGPNFDHNLDLIANNQFEIDNNNNNNNNNQECDRKGKAKICTDIVLWEPKTGKINPDLPLSETGNWIPDIHSANSSCTDLASLALTEQNNKNQEDEVALYDFAIRTITDSKLCLRQTARKSVRASPQLILSEKKSPKNEIQDSQFPVIHKTGISNPSNLKRENADPQFPIIHKIGTSNPSNLKKEKSDPQFPIIHKTGTSNPLNPKRENSESYFLIIHKSGISNPLILNPSQNGANEEPSAARKKIKELLKNFHTLYRKKVQEEEINPRSNRKVDFRTDLKSAHEIKESNLYRELNINKAILGPVPGVEIGDEFRYRVELHLVGLHRPPQSGIDWTEFEGVRVATSIVSSGGYSDEQCSSDVLIYSGSGGKPSGKKGQKSRPLDQKLEKGNLALKNSMELKRPVRVIHGLNVGEGRKVVMNFVYDGLYLVVDYEYVDEVYNVGNKQYKAKVFKFVLRRVAGQPEIGLHLAGKLKNSRMRDGFLMSDISKGKEKIPICVINTMDNEKPPKFDYITKVIYPSWLKKSFSKRCVCGGNCIECSCAAKNGGNIPFISSGSIVEEKNVIYECGPTCKCLPSCPNRVSQKGIIYKLEIFKKGVNEWGVRSLGSIASGTFVCEYVGEVRAKDKEIMIDARERGNVARFLKRSKSANLMVQKVMFDHGDEKMAHFMFFAAENIPPLRELTY